MASNSGKKRNARGACVILEEMYRKSENMVNSLSKDVASKEARLERLRKKYQFNEVDIEKVIGSKEAKKILRKEILNFMKYKDEFEKRGMEHPKGITLYGPPGVGKSTLARWVIAKLIKEGKLTNKVGYFEIKGHEVAAGGVGSINKKVSTFFDQLRADMKELGLELMILIIDEIDATIPKRTTSSVLTRERTSSLLKELEGFVKHKECIYVIGTTNRPYDMDSAAREGRIGRTLFIDVPSKRARRKLIKKFITSKDIKFEECNDGEMLSVERLAEKTNMFTGDNFKAIGADLLNEYLDNDKKPLKPKRVAEIFFSHRPNNNFYLQVYRLRSYATSELKKRSSINRKVDQFMKSFGNEEADATAKAAMYQEMEAERNGKIFRNRGD